MYTSLGLPQEGSRYWKSMIPQDRRMYLQSGFVTGKLKWGPVAVKNWEIFQQSKYAAIENNAAVPLMSDDDRKMPVPTSNWALILEFHNSLFGYFRLIWCCFNNNIVLLHYETSSSLISESNLRLLILKDDHMFWMDLRENFAHAFDFIKKIPKECVITLILRN